MQWHLPLGQQLNRLVQHHYWSDAYAFNFFTSFLMLVKTISHQRKMDAALVAFIPIIKY